MSKKQSTKLKDMLNEHYILGELPSSKLMKMKWNPVTGETMNEEEVAPKMKTNPFVKQIHSLTNEVDRIETVFKGKDSAGYSHTKRDFKKAKKAIQDLQFAVRRHSTNL